MEIYRLLLISIHTLLITKKDNTIDKFDRLMSLESQKDSQKQKSENKKTTKPLI